MFKLPKKVKDKWVKALRSGKYKQGKYFLSRGGYHCCLGVAVKENLCEKNITTTVSNTEVSTDFLPDSIQRKLMLKNDEDRLSFKEIASWIEENL